VLALSLHKGFTKNILRDAGLHTPNFAIVREEEDIDSVTLPYPLFAKPVAEGTGKGIDRTSKIDNAEDLRRRSLQLLKRYKQPVLIEEYLPGREFTVGILGTGRKAVVLGTLEVIIRERGEQGAYSYLNKERCEELVEYRYIRGQEVRAVEELSLRAWRILDCRDAGRVDIRLDAQGQPSVMEVNPLAGMHPTHSDLPIIATAAGMSYRELIGRIVLSARKRLEPRVSGVAQKSPVETEAVATETFSPV
jgi:D-alanine-D-alanine ligase